MIRYKLRSMKLKDLVRAQELCTYRTLQQYKYIQDCCEDAGYPGLKNISHATVRTILEGNEIKPNKISDYLERKVFEFKSKMHDVILIYKQMKCVSTKVKIC